LHLSLYIFCLFLHHFCLDLVICSYYIPMIIFAEWGVCSKMLRRVIQQSLRTFHRPITAAPCRHSYSSSTISIDRSSLHNPPGNDNTPLSSFPLSFLLQSLIFLPFRRTFSPTHFRFWTRQTPQRYYQGTHHFNSLFFYLQHHQNLFFFMLFIYWVIDLFLSFVEVLFH